jgi:bromodomain-containing factor 1
MTDADDVKTTSAPAQPEESTSSTAPDAKSAEPEQAPTATDEAPKPDSPKDVEMTDSRAENETESKDDSQGKSASPAPAEPSSKPSEETKKSPDTTSQADTTAPVAEPATEKARETSTPARPEAPSSSPEQAAKPASEEKTAAPEVDLGSAGISQLAIETTEGDSSNVEPSVEISMTDAPPAKVVREREDDATEEEPAAKRARTEPKEDEVAELTPVPAEGGSVTYPKARFDEFENWYEAENDAKEITPHRRREMRKVFARIKKTKAGGGFRDSVQRLWPQVWDKYSIRIEKPMDLGEIDRNLRDGKYPTFGEFKADLSLILENSQQFNGPSHDVTAQARTALWTLWVDVEKIDAEEPAKTKQAPKPPRLRESRSALVKPDEPTPSEASPVSAPPAAPVPAAPAAPPAPAKATSADARRASTATEGDRPKRTVRAPKSKDIDYTAKPSRKKLKPELQFCDEVLQELMSNKHWGMNQWFLDAVDAEGLGIPDYYSIIKNPMDLGKISRLLASGDISSLKDFDKHVKLMFENCYQFNGPPSSGGVSVFAKQLQDLYNQQMKGKDAWIAKHVKANPPPASASNASDEEEEDEEEEEAEEAPAGPDPSREVKELEVRLREETDKVNNLFTAEQPNQSMIEIQQGIVRVVQEALLKAKGKLNEYRQKHGAAKPAKKAKPAKPKTGGAAAAARKGSGNAVVAQKKQGNPKKKKILTPQDKDNIANAINDLEGPHLDRAIDIIKRDTGQMVRTYFFIVGVGRHLTDLLFQ